MHPRRAKTSLAAAGVTALTLLSASPARADYFSHFWELHHAAPQQLDLGVNFGFYQSSSNYDNNASLMIPAQLNGIRRLQADFTGSYGITPALTAYARVNWERVVLDHDVNSGDSFGAGDQSVGLSYRMLGAPLVDGHPTGFALFLQLQADIPAYDVESASASSIPWMGDGTLDLTAGAFGVLPVTSSKRGSISILGGAGYLYRGGNYTASHLSAALPWTIAVAYRPLKQGLEGQLAFHGLYSLSNDSRGLPPNTSSASVGSGGSFTTNAIDPSLVTLRGSVGYRTVDDLEIVATVAKSVYGVSAPNGLSAWIGVSTRFGGSAGNARGARELAPLGPTGKSNDGFIDYAYEAKVLRVNDRLNLVRIDKGKSDGVEAGQIYDIFAVRQDGSVGEAIARAQVTSVRSAEAALTVTEYFRETWIEEGFVAKRPLQ